ncbi:MAG: hypothetical protein E7356_01545 [Clostridiales bacterium]|nr:hypothetical protein [Clostridiales bacterium]
MSKVGVKFVDGGKVSLVETDMELAVGTQVVVESVRGQELAFVAEVGKSTDCGDEVKRIIREATDQDIAKVKELDTQIPKVKKITNDLIEKYKLDMKLVSVGYTIDGSKVIINYVCEDRVDFRELVKDLAGQLRLRVELRQIGIRDQAKIVGGIGFCGKECCCKKYLNDFDKVSIKMAKSQGLSLNPTKISGICGRLMCCLAYENEFYSEISSKMPRLNARVKTKDGIGNVIYNNLLKQKVTVKIDNNGEIKVSEYELAEIEVLPKLVDNQSKPASITDNAPNEKVESEPAPQSKAGKDDQRPKFSKKKKKFNKK